VSYDASIGNEDLFEHGRNKYRRIGVVGTGKASLHLCVLTLRGDEKLSEFHHLRNDPICIAVEF
jgi:hypothetical protein